MTNNKTKLAHLGRNKNTDIFPSVNIPVYRASTLVFPTLEEFYQADKGTHKHPGYGIYGNPTTFALEQALCELEEADDILLTSSGLEAITLTLMAFTQKDGHILVSDSVYGPTRDFCDKELTRFGVEVTYFNPEADGAEIKGLIRDNTSLVFLESPGSLTFEMQDIASIADVAHQANKDIVVVADNTWATQLYFKPFDHGIDISIHALTKYVGGHSDLLMGSISSKKKHFPTIKRICKSFGSRISGDDAYLALRGLRSMSIRLEQHSKSAMQVAEWLQTHDAVKKVIYPAMQGDAGYERWKKYMSGACGLFAFEIDGKTSEKSLAAFLDGLQYFGLGFSWGGFESLIIPYKPSDMRSSSKGKWSGQQLIRVNIGLEDPDDLIADLESGLARLG